jgi:hypothetical protein
MLSIDTEPPSIFADLLPSRGLKPFQAPFQARDTDDGSSNSSGSGSSGGGSGSGSGSGNGSVRGISREGGSRSGERDDQCGGRERPPRPAVSAAAAMTAGRALPLLRAMAALLAPLGDELR